jgi:predicted Rossmann-fold nucleotide-binding protein
MAEGHGPKPPAAGGASQATNSGTDFRPNPRQDPGSGDTCHSVGIRVDLPFERDVNAFVTHAFEHRTFFTRLHQFVLMSDAFVVVPGGNGTRLETMMVWQLLQVRKLHDTPLVLAGKMYADLVAWCRTHMLRPDCPLASPEGLALPVCVEGGPSILRIIRQHHERWKEAQERKN